MENSIPDDRSGAAASPASTTRLGRVAVLGLGNMGAALATAVVADDRIDATVVGAEPDGDRAARVGADLGITTGSDNLAAVAGADIVVLAVKPDVVGSLLAEVGDHIDEDTVVISVAAGVTIAAIEGHLVRPLPVVRIMPNTPMLVGEAMCVLTPGTHADDEVLGRAAALVGSAGQVRVLDERLFDAVTAVSGSGPAWVFALAEAMVEGAVAQGLEHGDAVALVEQTVKGAGILLATSDLDATGLRQMVSSPGGTTVAGLEILGQRGFHGAVVAAIAAATARGRELGAR